VLVERILRASTVPAKAALPQIATSAHAPMIMNATAGPPSSSSLRVGLGVVAVAAIIVGRASGWALGAGGGGVPDDG